MIESLLYPRLPPAIGLRLFEDARGRTLEELRERGRPSHPDAVFAAVGGAQVGEDHLVVLSSAIRVAADDAGFPVPPRSQEQRDRFDLGCASILREQMLVIAAEAASVDVWAFVGAVLLPDVCFWRFPEPPADRVIGPDLTRHAFARLWWRAYQLADLNPGGGLSALTAVPESEMNQLFERRTIGGNPALVRAIARVLLEPDEKWSGVGRRQLVRDSLFRIRRMIAFTMLEALNEDALEPIVRAVFGQTASALELTPVAPSDDLAEAQPAVEVNTGVDEPTAAEPLTVPAGEQFDDVLLARIPAQIATLVNELGGIADTDLVEKYEKRFGVDVPEEEHDLVRRFAWSAKGRRFIDLDQENDLWLPGAKEPAEVEQLGDWTIARVYDRAVALLRADPDEDPFQRLLHEVYRNEGGRVPRLVMRLVGRVVNRAKRDLNGHRPSRRRLGPERGAR